MLQRPAAGWPVDRVIFDDVHDNHLATLAASSSLLHPKCLVVGGRVPGDGDGYGDGDCDGDAQQRASSEQEQEQDVPVVELAAREVVIVVHGVPSSEAHSRGGGASARPRLAGQQGRRRSRGPRRPRPTIMPHALAATPSGVGSPAAHCCAGPAAPVSQALYAMPGAACVVLVLLGVLGVSRVLHGRRRVLKRWPTPVTWRVGRVAPCQWR